MPPPSVVPSVNVSTKSGTTTSSMALMPASVGLVRSVVRQRETVSSIGPKSTSIGVCDSRSPVWALKM